MNKLEEIATIELEIAELRQLNCPGQTPEFWAAVARLIKARESED